MKFQFLPLALAFALFSSAAAAQQSAPPPDADDHTKMNERSEQGMGFS